LDRIYRIVQDGYGRKLLIETFAVRFARIPPCSGMTEQTFSPDQID
jgi:hypothetical protein